MTDNKLRVSLDTLMNYRTCPSRAAAIEGGQFYDQKKDKQWLIKEYVLTSLKGGRELDDFKNTYKEILFATKKPNQLLKDYQIADTMSEILKADPYLMEAYSGENDVVVKSEIRNVIIESRLDSINVSKSTIVTLAVMTGLYNLKYNSTFNQEIPQLADDILTGNLDMLAWTNSYLAKKTFNKDFFNFIMAVSKENTPDKELVFISDDLLNQGKEKLLETLDYYLQVKEDGLVPQGCGKCDYCRANKMIEHSVTVEDLLGWN